MIKQKTILVLILYIISVTEISTQVFEGYTLYSTYNNIQNSSILISNNEDVIQAWEHENSPASMPYLIPDSSIIYPYMVESPTMVAGGVGGGVQKILCYEIPASTNWSGKLSQPFNPTEFNVISKKHLKKKFDAYSCYQDEVRPGNHPRSIDSLKSLAKYRGNSVGSEFAEAHVLVRNIIH